jgi:hypothetical protein
MWRNKNHVSFCCFAFKKKRVSFEEPTPVWVARNLITSKNEHIKTTNPLVLTSDVTGYVNERTKKTAARKYKNYVKVMKKSKIMLSFRHILLESF